MIEIKIPKEISEYKIKVISGFDFRESICIVLVCGISFVAYKTYGKEMSIDTLSNFIVPVILPIFAFGFVKFEGLAIDEYLKLLYRFLFLHPPTRVYREIDFNTQISEETLDNTKEMKKIYKEIEQETMSFEIKIKESNSSLKKMYR